jgi:hypothetical protein
MHIPWFVKTGTLRERERERERESKYFKHLHADVMAVDKNTQSIASHFVDRTIIC